MVRWDEPDDEGKTVATLARSLMPFSTGNAFHAGSGLLIQKPLGQVSEKFSSKTYRRQAMERMKLNAAFTDDLACKAQMVRDSETFRMLVENLKLKN